MAIREVGRREAVINKNSNGRCKSAIHLSEYGRDLKYRKLQDGNN